MTHHISRLAFSAAIIIFVLSGCAQKVRESITLSGTAAGATPLSNAEITVCDAVGEKRTAIANAAGIYSLDVSGMKAPLLVAATKHTTQLGALLTSISEGGNTANVNPLTDKIASEVAQTDAKLKGSAQLISACKPDKVTAASVSKETHQLRALVVDALKVAKVINADGFDPVTSPTDRTVISVLGSIRHNREGFSNSTSNERGGTILYDRDLQEIIPSNKLKPHLKPWAAYKTRLFIVGDSTASNYTKEVAPRMGWGQVFDRMIQNGADVKVVNVAQSGRSTRSFIAEGWLDWVAQEIKPGDYLLVQFGHNDEKCDVTGSIDWIFLCTYPNDATGRPHFPTGKPEYSFQKSLEKYIKLAKDKGATPILITPVTRIVQDRSVTTMQVANFPILSSTHITTKGAFPGNYAQTIIDTAKANNIPVIDIDSASIAFMNVKGEPAWRDYYLSVSDFVKYPYYKDKRTTGHFENPDRTHFQESGAVYVANMIADGIKIESERLSGLIEVLK